MRAVKEPVVFAHGPHSLFEEGEPLAVDGADRLGEVAVHAFVGEVDPGEVEVDEHPGVHWVLRDVLEGPLGEHVEVVEELVVADLPVLPLLDQEFQAFFGDAVVGNVLDDVVVDGLSLLGVAEVEVIGLCVQLDFYGRLLQLEPPA